MSARQRRRDVGIALVVAITVVVVGPGMSTVALLAILVLVACGISAGLERRSQRRRVRGVRSPTRQRSQRR